MSIEPEVTLDDDDDQPIEISEERIRQRGDANELLSSMSVVDADGNTLFGVPQYITEEEFDRRYTGDGEYVGTATGELYQKTLDDIANQPLE